MNLIDKDSLIEHMRKAYKGNIENGFKWDLESTVAVIGAEEDAEPIRHGHWEKQDDLGSTEWQLCSICKRITKIDTVFDRVFEYCPHCGASMDEVEE